MQANEAKCGGCGSAIAWVRMRPKKPGEKSKPAPVDLARLWVQTNPQGGERLAAIVTDDGRVVRGAVLSQGENFVAPPGAMVESGRVSHFATCPDGPAFRRKR